VIVFAVYAALVWYAAFHYRRRALGIAVALLSILPPLALTATVSYLNRSPQDTGLLLLNNLKGYGVVLHIFTVPYALVVSGVALIAATTRRHRPHITCPKCHYDLEGNATGQCPECGHILPPHLIKDIARLPQPAPTHSLPRFDSDEQARLAGIRSVRRIRLPEHLVHQDNATLPDGTTHDPLKHGAQRLRPHATRNRAPAGDNA